MKADGFQKTKPRTDARPWKEVPRVVIAIIVVGWLPGSGNAAEPDDFRFADLTLSSSVEVDRAGRARTMVAVGTMDPLLGLMLDMPIRCDKDWVEATIVDGDRLVLTLAAPRRVHIPTSTRCGVGNKVIEWRTEALPTE